MKISKSTHKKPDKTNFKSKWTKKKQNGGEKLGQGSYGCVIRPPVRCNNNNLRKEAFEISDNYISKIIKTKFNDVAFSELNIGQKISNIDKNHHYFVPFINACYFIPQKHPDISYINKNGKTLSNTPDINSLSELSDYNLLDFIDYNSEIPDHIVKENKHKCLLKNDLRYLNLIGPYGGENLSTILINKKSSHIEYIKNNYWYIFSYLINGLNLLHKKNIIHKDIKPLNIVVSFDYENDIQNELPIINSRFKYIDFGLTIHLNRKKYLSNDISDLLSDGTHFYTPMNIFAIKFIYKMIKQGYDIYSRDFLYRLMNKAGKIYQKNRDYYHNEGICNNYFQMNNNSNSYNNNKSYYLNPFKYEKIFKNILEMYKNNKIEANIQNYLYGWDIFSLGITLSKIYIRTGINDSKFKDVIFKMIEQEPEKRITINELLTISNTIISKKTSKNTSKNTSKKQPKNI